MRTSGRRESENSDTCGQGGVKMGKKLRTPFMDGLLGALASDAIKKPFYFTYSLSRWGVRERPKIYTIYELKPGIFSQQG